MALEVQARPFLIYSSPYFLGMIALVLVVFGIVLFVQSRKTSSKSLKAGILLPLITFALGLIWIVGDMVGLLDSGGYFIFGLLGGWLIVSVVSVIFSVVALTSIERKSLAWASIIYNVILFLIWLASVLTFDGM